MKYLTGYISSRSILNNHIPQKVQNILLRSYCDQISHGYLMGAAEYQMSTCYAVLRSEVDRLISSDEFHSGIVCYSINMLPDLELSAYFFKRIISARKSFHFFLEEIIVSDHGSMGDALELLTLIRVYSSNYSFS
jgi:sporadic carbohydrate cluster protein (TIGR04323 family)